MTRNKINRKEGKKGKSVEQTAGGKERMQRNTRELRHPRHHVLSLMFTMPSVRVASNFLLFTLLLTGPPSLFVHSLGFLLLSGPLAAGSFFFSFTFHGDNKSVQLVVGEVLRLAMLHDHKLNVPGSALHNL